MHHRLFEKRISPFVAFFTVAIIGSLFTLLIIRTIDTAEFLASETFVDEEL